MLKLNMSDLSIVTLTTFIIFLLGSIADGLILALANNTKPSYHFNIEFNITLLVLDILLTVLLFLLFIFSKKLSDDSEKQECRIPFITYASSLSRYTAVTSVVFILKNILILFLGPNNGAGIFGGIAVWALLPFSPFAIWLVISFIQFFINIFYIVYALSLEEKNCKTLFANSGIILAGIVISLLNTICFISCVLFYFYYSR